MARHGENIRKRKDGRWEGRYPIYSQQKGRKIYHSVYAATYEEVRTKLTEQKNQVKDTGVIQGNNKGLTYMKFSEMAQIWLASVKENRKPSTFVKYSIIYRNHVEEMFQEAALLDVTEAFMREKLSDLLSDSVKKSIYCVINQILKFAFDQYGIELPALRKPGVTGSNKAVRVLTRQEQRKLVSGLYQDMDLYKMAILLCLFTGLRIGELCALKWSDIDFKNKIFTVNRTVQRLYVEGSKTVLLEMSPKSECSRRDIPLSDEAVGLLDRFRNGKEYVFGGDKPLEPRTLQYHFKKLLAKTGVPDKNFHILRHTFSTNCIEGGMDVKSLSEMLGHSDVKITLNRYVHPTMDSKRQYMNALSRFYGQISGQAV